MYTKMRALESIVRISLVVVFLVSAIIPTPASAASLAYEVDGWWQNYREKFKQPSERPLIPDYDLGVYNSPYDESRPPNDEPNDPHPKPNLPAKVDKNGVTLTLDASPGIVGQAGKVEITAVIKNNTAEQVQGLVFSDKLEKEFTFISSDSDLVMYNSDAHRIDAVVDALSPGEEKSISYDVSIESKKNKDIPNGEVMVHKADLFVSSHNIQLKNKVVLWVGRNIIGSDNEMNVVNTAGGWAEFDQASVYFEESAVDQDYLVSVSDVKVPGGPAKQFKLELHKTDTMDLDNNGKQKEQKVKVNGKANTLFSKPVYIEVDFDDIADLNNIPAGKTPYVATYSEEYEVWVKVPIVDVDKQNNKVLVKARHFSIWGGGLGDSLPQNGANVLLFDQPYTSLFTGAASYSIPIWMPPGRANMAPSVSLSYSSSTANGVLGDIQSPWVGMGWNIDGIEIVRMITTDENGYGYENSFSLTLNGTSYELIRDLQDPEIYYAKDSAHLYVERHNIPIGNANLFGVDGVEHTDDDLPNVTHEWWEVVASDGTRYRLGWNLDSEQLTLMEGYECNEGDPCHTPMDINWDPDDYGPEDINPYTLSGYAGDGVGVVASRWRVDKVTDVHGNTMEYTYHEERIDESSPLPVFDLASYLETITYTGDKSGAIPPNYQVVFKHAPRTSPEIPATFSIWDHYDTQYLDEIEIRKCNQGCDGYEKTDDTPVRNYKLGYEVLNDGWGDPDNYTRVLTSMDVSGGGYTDQISIPSTDAAKVTFNYISYDNRLVADPEEDNVYKHPRLTKIDNGYGGTLEFHYVHDGRDENSWLNYRVSYVIANSGSGVAAYQGYMYEYPSYGPGGDLVGYADVTEVAYNWISSDPIILTRHNFGTSGLDVGREFVTEWKDPDNNNEIVRRAENVYASDNSQAPSDNWNFHYLYSTRNYEKIGGVLTQVNKTTYLRNPLNGEVVVQSDYEGDTLYRKQYYEYVYNLDPSVHILDRVSRHLLTDANGMILLDTHNIYDTTYDVPEEPELINPKIITSIEKGDLTYTQTVLEDSPSVTVDTFNRYDDYGNIIETRAYTSYGTTTVNVVPPNDYQITTTGYDASKTYPTTVTNDLQHTVTTNYLMTTGLPYEVIDANNIITKTAYDGLGRVLSVSVPEIVHSEPPYYKTGVAYTYPIPNELTGKVQAPYNIEMQIYDEIADEDRQVWGMYDGLGRILQNQVFNDENDKLLITDTHFNAQGQADRESIPREVSGTGGVYQTPNWESLEHTATEYDLFGRGTKVTPPAGEAYATLTMYDGLTTTVIDAEGHKVSQLADGLGRLIQVQEFTGTSEQDYSLYATTTYQYDWADRLIAVLDSQNIQTEITYDGLGRKLQMIDPDMGIWDYRYDPSGNMTQQIDARGESVCFYYDNLNRLTGKYYHDQSACPSSPSMDVSFGYDWGNLAIGQRTSMSDEAGSTSWAFSNNGRTVAETRTISGSGSYSFTTESDWLGRVKSIQYPDSEGDVTYTYDDLGRVVGMKDEEQTLLATLAYDVMGQITGVDLGNTGQINITNVYDHSANTYRLTDRLVQYDTSTYLDFDYFYDKVGNITQINDNKLDEILTYDYDDLNRLTSAEAIVDTDYSYRQQFEYDKAGNILKVREWDEDVIFKDDLEDGDLSAWSSNVNDDNDLSASDTNAFIGDYALSAVIDDATAIYVQDDSPDTETHYRARFYFTADDLTMADGDVFTMLGSTDTDSPLLVELTYTTSSGYQLRAGLINDSDSYSYTSWYTVDSNWHAVEIDWSAATSDGADDGFLSLWLDGIEKEKIYDVDNDTERINQVRLGAVSGLDAGTSGTITFDAFESRSITYIGLLPDHNPLAKFINPLKMVQITANGELSHAVVAPTKTPEPQLSPDPAATAVPAQPVSPPVVMAAYDNPGWFSLDASNLLFDQQVIGEVGQVTTASDNPYTVQLSTSFIDPVVFVTPPSYNEADPAVVRITDIQSDQFTFYIQDAPNVDSAHAVETVSYLVLEVGNWTVDGKQLEVRKVLTDASIGINFTKVWETVSFSQTFSDMPAILSQVQTVNDPNYVTTRENNRSTSGFDVAMEEEAAAEEAHGSEWIGWLAIDIGGGSDWSRHAYESGRASGVNGGWQSWDFTATFTQPPNFIGSMSTYHEVDHAHIRYRYLNETGIELHAEEDTTVGGDTSHSAEYVDFIAIEGSGVLYGVGVGYAPTDTPVPTATNTATPTFTPTNEGEPTFTPTETPTPTYTPTDVGSATETFEPKILAHWDFNEGQGSTASDDSGTLIANLYNSTWWFGITGYCADIRVASSYISIPNKTQLEPGVHTPKPTGTLDATTTWLPDDSLTISAWIMPRQFNPKNDLTNIINKGGNHRDYVLALDNEGHIIFLVNDLEPKSVTGPIVPLHEWTYVAGVYDSGLRRIMIYVNGALAASAAVTGKISYGDGGFVISDARGGNFIGKIDEVTLYERALAPEEVYERYTNISATGTAAALTATVSPPVLLVTPPTPTQEPEVTEPPVPPDITPTPEPDGWVWGTGDDGALIIATATTFNIHEDESGGLPDRCADGGDAVAYQVDALTAYTAVLTDSVSADCLMPNDEVLLINMQGTDDYHENVGHYELLRVHWVDGKTVYFTTAKTQWYGEGIDNDHNIGDDAREQRVMLMRVPNYSTAQIDGTLTGNIWDAGKHIDGVIAFRVSDGTDGLSGSGTIDADTIGYNGGTHSVPIDNIDASQGSSYPGAGKRGVGENNGGGGGVHAGGGYGTNCLNSEGAGKGGLPYGEEDMHMLFMGSGGGGGKYDRGGRGGGLVLIIANTITMDGTITADGEDGAGNSGAGSGGGIRLEVNTIDSSGLSLYAEGGTGTGANGEGSGGEGRIAIYFNDTLNGVTPIPEAYKVHDGIPEVTPTPTLPVDWDTRWGTGFDGNATVPAGQTVNLTTDNLSDSHLCRDGGDAIVYVVTGLNASAAVVDGEPIDDCLEAGDEVMLINVRGDTLNYANVGNYEFLRVGDVDGSMVLFTSGKEKYYGEEPNSDGNIGTDTGQQRVLLVRVPNYNDLEVYGTLTVSAWDTKLEDTFEFSGVLPIRVKNELIVYDGGVIDASGLGFAGGGPTGESYPGYGDGDFTAYFGGGGRGSYGGGGGGYGTEGEGGVPPSTTEGGHVYGSLSLDMIFFGSGGGKSSDGVMGGSGGGIIWISANALEVESGGVIKAEGANGTDANKESGAGSGGSIYLSGNTVVLPADSVSVDGGVAPKNAPYQRSYGGDGGLGRSAVYYEDVIKSSINAVVQYIKSVSQDDILFADDFESGDLSAWDSNVNDEGDLAVTDSADYWGDYGLSAVVDDTASIYTQDDSPGGSTYYNRFYADASDLTLPAGDVLDIFTGNDGVDDNVRVQLQNSADGLQARIGAYDDSDTWLDSDWCRLVNANIPSCYLVAYWDMDETGGNRSDAYGDNHLTDHNTVTYLEGLRGNAANFERSNQEYLSIPSNENLQLGDVDFYFGTWVKLELLGDNQAIFSKWGSGGKEISALIGGLGKVNLALNGETRLTSTEALEVWKWYYIEVWHDAANDIIGIGINRNEQVASYSDGVPAGNYDLTLGWQNTTARYLDGLIDEFVFYKGTTLSAEERDALYGEGAGISFSMKPEQDWHAYRVEWGSDGDVELHLDENNTVAVPGLNNQGQTIESARLGAMGVDAATSGSISFDEFESHQHSLPQLLPDAGAADPEPPAIPSWLDATYSYDGAQAHAVTSVERQQPGGGASTDSYEYDANGNMSCRIEGGVLYKHWYGNANRLESIKQYAGSDCADPGTLQQTWSFYYDGDGTRVKEEYIVDGVVMYTRHLLGGGMYEFTDDGTDITTRQYYNVGGTMVAMKEWVNEGSKTTNYFASDHLSSTSLVMDSSGNLLSENRYMPFGEVRTISGTTNITETDFGYTGQRDYTDNFGLMDYHARFYSPALARFTQPDTVVPDPGNSQAWNRYSYTLNNPVKYNDPTGHTASGGGYGGMDSEDPDPPIPEPGYEDPDVCPDPVACDLERWDEEAKNWKNPLKTIPENIDMALMILASSEADITDKLLAAYYLDWVAVGAVCLAGAALLLGAAAIIETGSFIADLLCMDGDCTDEARAAGEFTIDTANKLKKISQGTGNEVHHIVEQRFSDLIKTPTGKWPSIILSPEQHQPFTNSWRDAIGYIGDINVVTTTNAVIDDVWIAAQDVYAEYPALLDAASKTIFGH